MDESLQRTLRDGIAALSLPVDDIQCDALLEYLALLQKWNRAYNLTAVRDAQDMVVRHLLDSLAIAPFFTVHRAIDVGTGAGLPGIVLAILFPERDIHLLDSNGKKTRFLFQVKTALGLDNITVHHARVETHVPAQPYDAVLSRAFASLEDMVTGARHLLGPDGHFLAMKGNYPESELAAIENQCELVAVHSVHVPFLPEQRHLVDLRWRADHSE